jgi:hypothetical protein
LLDRDFLEAVQRGFTMIAAGFGSFAIFDGLTVGQERNELPKIFALIITALGVIVIVLALNHHRKMIAWVNADEFGDSRVPRLPDERRTDYLAAGAAIIGVVSFIALIFLP